MNGTFVLQELLIKSLELGSDVNLLVSKPNFKLDHLCRFLHKSQSFDMLLNSSRLMVYSFLHNIVNLNDSQKHIK